jgi:periodic tryptophan protein 1
MITTSAWVRRGVAAQFPTKYEIDEEEMNRISKLARMQLEDAREDLSAAQEQEKKEGDAMEEDDDDDVEEKHEKKDASDKMSVVDQSNASPEA